MTLEEAVKTYLARRVRTEHPDGAFDKGGRWQPSAVERQGCCDSIRYPSRAYPYSLMTHCRTVGHVARRGGIDEKALRKAVNAAKSPPSREGGDNYYKAVALMDGRMLSIYDGITEYQIGVTLRQAPHRHHNGGHYVYSSPADAGAATLPTNSALLGAPRLVIRVRAEGSYCRYDNGKLAFGRVTPLEVVGHTEPTWWSCPRCLGSGESGDYSYDGDGQYDPEPCPKCGGEGTLKGHRLVVRLRKVEI